MAPLPSRIASLLHLLAQAALETAWPTRCALCDAPGTLLCEDCLLAMPFIDHWRACPACGAPYGLVQCCTCNPVMMPPRFEQPPFSACVSSVHLTRATGRIATLYKDRNERMLSVVMACIMAWTIPPSWQRDVEAVTFVPATRSSFRRRGFDHAELLAASLAEQLGLPVAPIFERPASMDQRDLSRESRFANMQRRFVIIRDAPARSRMLLIDDVFTTGATLFAACQALRAHGAEDIRCATFARA